MGVEGLITRLADRSRAEARRSAAEALRQLGPEANASIPALLRALVDADAMVRQAALQALQAIDPAWSKRVEVQPAISVWVTALKNGSQVASESAAKLLVQAGPVAVAGLAQVLSEGGDVIENVLVLRVLRQIGPDSASAVPEMTHALGSQFAQVRIAAAHALASAGHAAAPAVPSLSIGLNDWNADVRQAMARCLAHIAPAAGFVAPEALGCADDCMLKLSEIGS